MFDMVVTEVRLCDLSLPVLAEHVDAEGAFEAVRLSCCVEKLLSVQQLAAVLGVSELFVVC